MILEIKAQTFHDHKKYNNHKKTTYQDPQILNLVIRNVGSMFRVENKIETSRRREEEEEEDKRVVKGSIFRV